MGVFCKNREEKSYKAVKTERKDVTITLLAFCEMVLQFSYVTES